MFFSYLPGDDGFLEGRWHKSTAVLITSRGNCVTSTQLTLLHAALAHLAKAVFVRFPKNLYFYPISILCSLERGPYVPSLLKGQGIMWLCGYTDYLDFSAQEICLFLLHLFTSICSHG